MLPCMSAPKSLIRERFSLEQMPHLRRLIGWSGRNRKAAREVI